MGVNGVSGTNAYEAYTPAGAAVATAATATEQSKSTTGTNTSSATETAAATYEKSTEQSAVSKAKDNTAIIKQMKADADARNAQLRSLVEKMMIGQGNAVNKSNDIFSMLRSGNLKVDAKTAAQAQKDIAEDGYWGVEQTSDRLVSFAKALAGDDVSKADTLINAMKKGFGEAKKAWGGNLPDISQKTIDAALKKMDEWKNGTVKA